jgi:hypothetical protein
MANPQGGGPVVYEVVILGAARQAVVEMDRADQQQVAKSLREELWCRVTGSPLTVQLKAVRARSFQFDPRYLYFAASLSSGHVAYFRCMTAEELKNRRTNPRRLRGGRMVFGLLAATSTQ